MSRIETTASQQYGHPRQDFDVAGGRGFVILPRRGRAAGPRPWVWYAPSFIVKPYPLPKPLHEWYMSRLLEAGFAVAGVDVGDTWGCPAGRETFTAFHRTVVEAFSLDAKACLFPQSRGAMMHYNWAAEHPECVRCIAAIYPVCAVRESEFAERIAGLYGLTPEQLLAEADQHSPVERLAPLAAAKVPVLHLHGEADTVVPLETHSAELVRRYRALGGPGELVAVPGQGHEEVPAFFQHERFLAFLLAEGGDLAEQ